MWMTAVYVLPRPTWVARMIDSTRLSFGSPLKALDRAEGWVISCLLVRKLYSSGFGKPAFDIE
jgi:hypothetical protein